MCFFFSHTVSILVPDVWLGIKIFGKEELFYNLIMLFVDEEHVNEPRHEKT